MTSWKLFQKIEDLILQNICTSYNPNTKNSIFSIFRKEVVSSQKINFSNFDLLLGQKEDYPDLIVHKWRLPSTRVYFTKLSSKYFTIEEISYFNFSIILGRNDNHQQSLVYQFENVESNSSLYFSDGKKIVLANSLNLNGGDSFIVFINSANSSKRDIYRHLSEIINHEKQINPVNTLQSYDKSFLEKIDSHWSICPFNGEGNIKDSSLEYNIFLLKELGSYTGVQYNVPGYNSIYAKEGFSNLLSNVETVYSDSTRIKLQCFWDEISLPSRKYFIANFAKENTNELVSFLILSFANGCWWAETAKDYLVNFITPFLRKDLHIFNLIFELKTKFNISSLGNSWRIYSYPKCNISIKHDTLFFKQTIKKETNSVTCQMKDSSFSIDKKAMIHFDAGEKQFNVNPYIFNYNFTSNNCTISIDENKYKIVLAWKNFTLLLGSVRIKFLFKKSRYQLSIKAPKWISEIKVNDLTISFKESLYQKIYLEIEKTVTSITAHYYDDMGRSRDIASLIKGEQDFRIHSVIKNRYGHLADCCTIQNEGTKKIYQKKALEWIPDKIKIDDPFIILNPKVKPVNESPVFRNSLVESIKYTDADILENRMAVFVEDKNNIGPILDLFISYFRFKIKIYSVDQLKEVFYRYNIVVCDPKNIDGKEIYSHQFYTEIQLKNMGNKRIINIRASNLHNCLLNVFHCQK